MRTAKLRLLFAPLAVLILFGNAARSQAISGDLSGTVYDSSGASVMNVLVAAQNLETGVTRETKSNSAGQYRFMNLAVGTYSLSGSLTGFSTAKIDKIEVELNKVSTVNLSLEIAGVTMSLDVTDAPQALNTTTAQLQDTFGEQAIVRIPLASSGLGVLNLALLSSGVAGNGGVGAGVGPSVGGQRPRNNNYTVEGVDNNDKASTGPKVLIPSEAVAEFTLLKNQFAPEYGHSSGGQFNLVLKSGSNDFHATLYEYLQNRKLNATDVAFKRLGVTENPRSDESQLGVAVGGPILRNKWFYFANLEYAPVGEARTPGSDVLTPTQSGYTLLGTIPGLSAANLGALKQYVPASSAATTTIPINGVQVPFGPLAIIAPNFHNTYTDVVSSDYQISERDQLRGRFVYNRNSFTDTSGVSLPAFFLQDAATRYLATLAEYHTFSASLLNEFRLGYNRQNQLYSAGNFQFPGLSVFPNLTFDDLGLQLGPNPQAPQGSVQNVYQATDNITWLRGAHTLTVGTEFRKHIAPNVYTQRSRGDYEYSSVDLFLRDITPDASAIRGLGNVRFYGDQIATYWYAQDAWRVRPHLTLSLGLRYEYSTVPFTSRLQSLNAIASVPGVLDFAEPTAQKTAFAPRVGIAWSPGRNADWAIRAGFGMAYDVLADNLSLLALPPQLGSMADFSGQGLPGFLAGGGIPANIPGDVFSAEDARASTAFYIPTHTKLPYSVQWNFGIQHVFAKDYTFEARYVGTRGVHLPVQQQMNRVARVSPDFQVPLYLASPNAATLAALPVTVGDIRAKSSILPAFAAAGLTNPITAWTPQGESSYHGLSLDLNRRFSKGLQVSTSYTWSHVLDNSTSEVGSTFLTPRRAQDAQNLRSEWATSMLDRRHRFTAMAIYTSHWLRNSNWFNRNILGNWEFAPTYVYESPEYFTVQSAIDSNLNGDSAGDRAWVNPEGVAHTASDIYGLDRAGNRIGISASTAQLNSVVAWVAVNPNARYIRAGYGVMPTGGRNTEPTRPINNVNLSLIKRLPLTERLHMELGIQGYNLFNHAQFVPGLVNSIDAVTTAYTPGVHNYATAGHAAFGDAEAVFSSNPRIVQVLAKLVW
jgi:hypothetical protein